MKHYKLYKLKFFSYKKSQQNGNLFSTGGSQSHWKNQYYKNISQMFYLERMYL